MKTHDDRTRLVKGRRFLKHMTSMLFAITLASAPFQMASAQVAPSLGAAESFGVLGASTVTNTGPTIITGDLGLSPGTAVTGFPPGIVIGDFHVTDAVAAQAQADTTAAYNDLAGQACDTTFGVPTDIGGLTLVPGVYCFSSSAFLTGALTLNAQGDPNAVWVFKVASTLITASNSSVIMINGAQNCNVFWQVGSSATLGTGTSFVGNILALTSITLNTNADLSGRALAQNGAVTMDTNDVTASFCAIQPDEPIPPTVSKTFSPGTIDEDGTSSLVITFSNPDTSAASLSAPFTDTLPSGVVTSGTGSTTCGGVVTNSANSVTLTGGSIPANSSCTLTIDVTAANGGNYINSIPAGELETSNGDNAAPAVSTLTVTPSNILPTIGKAFSPATIDEGGVSSLVITLSNGDDSIATLTAPFTDTLPAGVTTSGAGSTTCGGVVTNNANSVTLTGGAIPANGSCTVTINVTAADSGSFINSIPAGELETSNGNNAAPAVATITVNAPDNALPTIGKTFTPATIDEDGISSLVITLSNSSDSIATLTAPFTDTLPAGVVTSGAGSTTCGGVVTNNASSVTLTGGAIPANGSCTVTINVTAANGGNFFNSIPAGALQTSNGNNAAPVVATLTVIPSTILPTIGKVFTPASINENGSSTLVITLSNSSDSIATLTAPFTDTLPAGVVTSGAGSTTCGGVVTNDASSVTLTGGAIPANGSCTVTINVTAPNVGSFINTIAAGALQTSNGNNAAPVVATLTVVAIVNTAPTLSKNFSPSTINIGKFGNRTSTLTITLTNPNSVVANLTAPLTDNLPDGIVTSGNGSTTCGGVVTVTATSVTLTGGSIPANGSCTVKVNVTGDQTGTFNNVLPVGALETSQGSNALEAAAVLNVICTGKSCNSLK